MSAADAGRKKIENRGVEYVEIGDVILDEHGQEFEVSYWRSSQATAHSPRIIRLVVRSLSSGKADVWRRAEGQQVRVRRNIKA